MKNVPPGIHTMFSNGGSESAGTTPVLRELTADRVVTTLAMNSSAWVRRRAAQRSLVLLLAQAIAQHLSRELQVQAPGKLLLGCAGRRSRSPSRVGVCTFQRGGDVQTLRGPLRVDLHLLAHVGSEIGGGAAQIQGSAILGS